MGAVEGILGHGMKGNLWDTRVDVLVKWRHTGCKFLNHGKRNGGTWNGWGIDDKM